MKMIDPQRELLHRCDTMLPSILLVDCLMLCWFSTHVYRHSRAWLPLKILALIPLSNNPSLKIKLPRYLKSFTIFSVAPSTEVEVERTLDPGAGSNKTSVFPRLMVRPNRCEASENLFMISCRSDYLCAIRAQSLTNSAPKIILSSVLVFALRHLRSNNDPPSMFLRNTPWSRSLTAWVSKHVMKRLNRMDASIQPSFMSFEMWKNLKIPHWREHHQSYYHEKGGWCWQILSDSQVLTV